MRADEVTEQVLVRSEFGSRAFDGDPPRPQHVAAVGDLERPPGVLLDDENGAAVGPQLDESELRIEPLLVIDEEHRIPAAVWERLRAHLAA